MDGVNLWQFWQTDTPLADISATTASSTSSKMSDIGIRTDLQRLALIVEAMWELMKERGLTDDDLLAKIAELDLSDGVADGKKAKAGPVRCPRCSRPNSRRHDFCIYCGELIRSKPFQ